MAKKPDRYFFRFAPGDQQPGFNPLVGDVEPEHVYEVRPELADRFVDHPQWAPATKREFDAQFSEAPDDDEGDPQ